MHIGLLVGLAVSAWWQGECPNTHSEYYLMSNSRCNDGLDHLIFQSRCVEAGQDLALKLQNTSMTIVNDVSHPKGCFYNAEQQLMWFNTAGKLQGGSTAFQAICARGARLQTWGLSSNGGDSTTVGASLLDGVMSVYTNEWAFAALKVDGTVVAWGDPDYGGDATGVITDTVADIVSTAQAFAAISHNGQVFTWGKSCSTGDNCGGNSSTVASLLSSGVVAVYGSASAFAAVKQDRSVVTWGSSTAGGDMSTVAQLLRQDVSTVYSSDTSFTVLTTNGTVVSWGGGVAAPDISYVMEVSSTKTAFAARMLGGDVVAWGASSGGGDDTTVQAELAGGVVGVTGNSYTFAAWKEDGTVVTWGRTSSGSNSSTVAGQLVGVKGIASNLDTFVALKTSFKSNWAAAAWGGLVSCCGGNASSVSELLASNVETVYSAQFAYAALLTSGKVVTWGNIDVDPSVYEDLEEGVDKVCSSRSAFAAIKANGSVVAWGTGFAANLSIKGEPLGQVAGKAVLLASAGQAYAVGISATPPPSPDSVMSNGEAIALAVVFGVAALGIIVGGPVYMRYRKRRDRAVRRRRIRSIRQSLPAPRKPIFVEDRYQDSNSEVSED
eukprot:TRINITY_DN16739_c0_g1_i1.p1 TRINITY_DN16739_c0_g1~~TRINITY_DN16739_c0_g1_i1.p1  ORF type:complete len:607 (+),score=146.92 TRINITY_DN16739_c0_g1_i1:64-1884(+)